MALTDFCDVYAGVHEDGFNRLIFHVMSQRPSLFNYGTGAFVSGQASLCCPPEFVHPEVKKRGNPVISPLPYLPIPGYTGDVGLEYNFSLSKFEIDFEPTNKFTLPTELGTKLKPQSFALKAVICGGIACPEARTVEQFTIYPEPYRPDLPGKDNRNRNNDKPPSFELNTPKRGLPFNPKNVHCFQLELYAVLNFERQLYMGETVLGIKLQGLEIVDIKPDGLENSLECYMRLALQLGILPKLRVAMNDLALAIGDFITIMPTPVSASVPFNPSAEKDTLSVFLTLQ